MVNESTIMESIMFQHFHFHLSFMITLKEDYLILHLCH